MRGPQEITQLVVTSRGPPYQTLLRAYQRLGPVLFGSCRGSSTGTSTVPTGWSRGVTSLNCVTSGARGAGPTPTRSCRTRHQGSSPTSRQRRCSREPCTTPGYPMSGRRPCFSFLGLVHGFSENREYNVKWHRKSILRFIDEFPWR